MTRPHPHGPDETWARAQYAEAVEGLSLVAATIDRGRAHDGIVNAGVDDAFEAAALGWFLGEPLATVRGHLAAGLPFVRYRLAKPDAGAAAPQAVVRWVALAAVVGYRDVAAGAAARLAPDARAEQPGEQFYWLLAALALGEDDAARAWADRLAAALGDPAAPPQAVHAFGGLAEIATAGLAGDAAGQQAALRARGDVTARYYRRTTETRRSWVGLLDHHAAAAARLSNRAGEPAWPDGVPSLPVPVLTGAGEA